MSPDAALGRRIGAALFDLLVLFLLFVALAVLIGDTSSEGGSFEVRNDGADFLVFVAVSLLYYGGSELLTGQTLGKRLAGVRVVRVDGSRAGAGAIVLRTLLRVVDGQLLYLVGLGVAFLTGERRQRLGDLAGRTVVVRTTDA
jgi:uncharacterized RDD family membrane protein YckC